MKIWIPATVIFLSVVGLMAMGLKYGAIPELHVSQVLAGERPAEQVRVLGIIESIETEHRPLRFRIRDFKNPRSVLEVEVDDARPELYRLNTDVAVRGYFNAPKGVLEGDKIYTKCPSKYEAAGERSSPSDAQPAEPARAGT